PTKATMVSYLWSTMLGVPLELLAHLVRRGVVRGLGLLGLGVTRFDLLDPRALLSLVVTAGPVVSGSVAVPQFSGLGPEDAQRLAHPARQVRQLLGPEQQQDDEKYDQDLRGPEIRDEHGRACHRDLSPYEVALRPSYASLARLPSMPSAFAPHRPLGVAGEALQLRHQRPRPAVCGPYGEHHQQHREDEQ